MLWRVGNCCCVFQNGCAVCLLRAVPSANNRRLRFWSGAQCRFAEQLETHTVPQLLKNSHIIVRYNTM